MSKLEIIKRNVTTTHELIAAPADHLNRKNNGRETISTVNRSEIVGRDEDKKKLVAMLIDPGNNQDDRSLSVIPIVGIGGLGKTTLAQLVYNDEQVETHFVDLKMWICVSDDDFNAKKLLGDIVKSTGRSMSGDALSLEMMAQELKKILAMKKFFLVLDDVWKKESDKNWEENWEILRNVLLCGAKGSKIIVTTRSEKVADIMGTLPTHILRALSDDESLSLFNQRAFGVGGVRGDEETDSLAPIAKKIVEMCIGVPLAVKAIRSVLHSKRDKTEWLSILNSELWGLPDEKNKILPALRLSYDHLPSHLKPCFSFCSIFPKDHRISIDTLIQLWMAEGLLQPQRGNMLMEDVGLEYFKEELSSSFFQDEWVNEWGNIIYCKMHDLFHDLALSVSRAECCVLDSKRTEKNISEMRRFRVAFDQETTAMPEALDMATKLRVFFMDHRYTFTQIAIDDVSILVKFKSLRVLVLRDLVIKELPHSLVMLKHLRFLDLQNMGIEVLPMWITSLYNLQTISVRFCHELKQLPSSIEKLINLRHFDIYGNSECTDIVPKGIGQLKFLQTIPTFQVGIEEGHHITELKHLDHLRGTLKLVNLENVRSREDAKSANLKQKQGIHELVLEWSNGRGNNNIDGDNERNDDEVLEGLQPHPHLKELKIDGCEGTRFPTWLTHTMLPNLVDIIILRSLSNCEQLPAFELFKHLKNLCIFGMRSLKRIGIEFYGAATHSQTTFPSLRQLYLYDLENLEEWVEAPTVSPSSSSTSSYAYPFPLLEALHIINCPNLRIVPTAFPYLGYLRLSNVTSMVVQMLGKIKLPALTNLDILGISNLMELPQGSLQNKNHLRFLYNSDCPSLQTFNNELQYLTALEELDIGGFSDEMSSFRFLDEEEEEEEAEESSTGAIQQRLPFYNNLRRLNVQGCTLPSLPKRIQHFTALESLWIRDFCNMEALPEWLGNLSSLQFLEIYHCDRLIDMPSAEAMRRLCSLRELTINRCPCLTKRCAKDQGQEWYKISHIPTIQIEGEYIKRDYDR